MIRRIKSRIIWKISVLVAVQIAILVVGAAYMAYLQSEGQQLGNSVNMAGKTRFLTANLLRVLEEYTTGEASEEEVNQAMKQLEDTLHIVKTGGVVPGTEITLDPLPEDLIGLWEDAEKKWKTLQEAIDVVREKVARGDFESIEREDDAKLEELTFALVDAENKLTNMLGRYVKQISGELMTLQVIVGGVNAGVLLLILYFIARMLRPIGALQQTAAVISSGDLTKDVEVKSSDEIGRLASAFSEMSKGLRNIVGQSRAIASDIASATQQTAASIEQVNSSVQQLTSTIQQIANGSQTQSQELEKTNRVIERLNTTMKELAERAQSAAEHSANVGRISEQGGRAASQAAEKMSNIIRVASESSEMVKRLAERTSQITTALDVIRKIADQTNLLALNAAIEAARAGEAGRGFAVVADEVRRLAEGSAKASEEIAAIIKQVQEEADLTVKSIETASKEITEGREVIDEALKSLKDVAERIQVVASNAEEISESIQQQAQAVEELAKSASEIAAVAEENAAATEQASSAAEELTASMEQISGAAQHLAEMAQNLQHTIARFKLPDRLEEVKETQAPPKPAEEKETPQPQPVLEVAR